MNHLTLYGKLGRDPETRTVGESDVCHASLATTERWRAKDGQDKESVQWHKIEAWGSKAGILARMRKGSPLLVSGKLIYNEWQDKDGNKRKEAVLRIDDLQVIQWPDGDSGARQSSGPSKPVVTKRPTASNNRGADNDIPF